jgi:chromosome segregation protein
MRLRQVYRAKQEESFQLNKSLEIREIQISSFKQELERTTTDTSHQSASIAEFEKKTVVLMKRSKKKTFYLEKLKKEEEDVFSANHLAGEDD